MTTPKSADLDVLFEPLELTPDLKLPTRVIMGAVTRNRGVSPLSDPPYKSNGFDAEIVPSANKYMLDYYVQRARGGAGLITSEGTLVSRQGTEWENAPGLWSDSQIEGWKQITDAVHKEGAPIFAQLWHVGRCAHPDMPEQIRSGEPVWAPSAVAAAGGGFHFLPGKPGFQVPTAVEDPNTLVQVFKDAAIRAKAAGFDGVEIHSAGGYVLQQFLDTSSNHREDSWGGSIPNRARLTLAVIDACVSVFSDPRRVGIKLMPQGGFNDVGMPEKETRETYGYLLEEIEKIGIGYVSLLRSEVFADPARTTAYDCVGHFSPYLKKVNLFVGGGVSFEEATNWIKSGTATGVVFSQKWINNPDLVNRLKQDLPIDTVPIDWQHIYSWETTPAEGYSALEPIGGFVGRITVA